MDQSTQERQELEITALKSIYEENFFETPPPKAWKGAVRLPEFTIRVVNPNDDKVNFHLNVKLPKTYPNLACPIFTVQKPIEGLNNEQVTTLSQRITAEAQKYRGQEMVFQIIDVCQDWMKLHVKPRSSSPASLALQMAERAMLEGQARQEREAEERERAVREAQEREEEFKEEAMRQLAEREQLYKARKRANSETTEIPMSADTMTESFPHDVEVNGVTFNTVRLFHPRQESLGTVYLADPICDDINTTLPLELYVVNFYSHYYTTSQGRKKLKQVEAEIQRLTTIRHPNHTSVFAVKLTQPHSSGPSQLMVLSEQAPALTLQDVLEDCQFLREDRASEYLAQILAGLNAIHAGDLVHRGINARCIGLASGDRSGHSKQIKLGRVGFPTRLLDLHRSNPFGTNIPAAEECQIPDGWLSRDEKNESSLLYTRQRDIHAVGIVLLQMLLGLDVTEKYANIHEALQSSHISASLARHATNMILPSKKTHASCLSLLGDLAETSFESRTHARTPARIPPTPRTADMRTPVPYMNGNSHTHEGSPDAPSYFPGPPPPRAQQHVSRWKEDWEELELLGKGAFGSVVKARNKIDNRIYAVKKVRLKTDGSDVKIFREVNALSRLSHRFIVRYFTTWIEVSQNDPHSTPASDDSETESGTEESGMTSVPSSGSGARYLPANGGGLRIDFDTKERHSLSSKSSFPSIHFGGPESPGTGESSGSEDGDGLGNLFAPTTATAATFPVVPRPTQSRTLYIQMEFVERQTLKERIEEGIAEDEAWRLFQQILDALVHMSTLSILHRDIKLTNIFIDAKGDCKVGDFGLATSSLAAVDPSDVSPKAIPTEDMTLEVGTRLYIAPEVQSRKRGPRNHNKADMYSLGIVFFEMNYTFSTGSERIAVIEDLRKPGIFFPPGWDPRRTRQREIITWLLQHRPDDRPTALELSQSPLLPQRLEDEYFKGALSLMTKADSPHQQAVLNSLFSQPPRPSRGFIYDLEADMPEHAALNDIVQERLAGIFRLHGAVDMEPPLIMPVMDVEDESQKATFIDRHGDVVTLPDNMIVPFARLAARGNIKRIKRYHIGNIFRPNPVAGHPKVQKAAVFDIITPDLESGPLAAGAELLAVAGDCLDSFPNLTPNYDIHASHSGIVQVVLARLPSGQRNAVVEILGQSKATLSQKRALLLKRGLLRSTADELELLSEIDEDIDGFMSRLERISPSLLSLIGPYVQEVKKTVDLAKATKVSRPILFHPLMLGNHHVHFRDGVLVEVVRKNKRSDVLAAGGRYDNLIGRHAPLKSQSEPICGIGIQIAVEKITVALASYQSSSVKALVKEERSFGYWSPRRCDVYVVSYHPGHLQERLEVVSYLWQHNISADLMYESGLPDGMHEDHLEMCVREGILFTVYPRPRAARQNQPAFKVKSILRGSEIDLSRQELVSWLQHEIAEQKRIDLATSGAPNTCDTSIHPLPTKDPAASDVQLLLPSADIKKQRKHVKQLFYDRGKHDLPLPQFRSVHSMLMT
ncbi:putative anticodon binding domain of tRNAs [Lyophyllum shimeji]|uniref:non-specific serine/threonine protein kinase n=1 Tax=Lyophyllum shimeji TaxID=47721 RepID=A0A9P3PJ12_LYOSH|nr:putative anticodon binding domain of tRNAs [Lyophyllum shimeji]